MDKSNITEDYLETEELEPNNFFESQIIEYEEPEYLPNTIINFPLDKKEINDFTELSGTIKMSDYKKSFDNSTIEMNTKNKNYQLKNTSTLSNDGSINHIELQNEIDSTINELDEIIKNLKN